MHVLGTFRQQDVFFRSNDRGAWFPEQAGKRGGLDIAIRDVTSVISTNRSNVLRVTRRQERRVAQSERFAGRLRTPENVAVKFPNEIAFENSIRGLSRREIADIFCGFHDRGLRLLRKATPCIERLVLDIMPQSVTCDSSDYSS